MTPSTSGFIYDRSEYNAEGQIVRTGRDTGSGADAVSMAPTLYEYDAFGNLVKQTLACDDEPSVLNSPVQEYAYGVENTEDGVYNSRSELIGDQLRPGGRFGYQYDNIGNRKTSFEFGDTTDYTTTDLNQYAGIVKNGDESFIPFYDEDGNQTKVKTSTGIWNVSYNAENRPVKFENGEGTTMYLNLVKVPR